ncbi:MAG: RluA family pseudouridine synthase [Proteobacteria bacterium]|nr:RluA family pseudouridine synthase [Pseudomonadota bacterium]
MILYVDAALIAIDKPAGLPAVPGRPAELRDCVASRVQALYPDALVVHRLDMATSGLMLMARGRTAQQTLSRAFEARHIDKTYEAWVAGSLAEDAGTIALPLAADWPNRPRQRVDAERGKPAITHWRVLARQAGATRLALHPITGRSHQLRVHLAAIGHPILGDALYAPQHPAARLLLHAQALTLPHPASGAALSLQAPLPPGWLP